MALPTCASVRPLRLAENQFLEVLLSKFELNREGNGVHLEAAFDSETPSCWNRAGREALHEHFAKSGKIPSYQALLDDVLIRRCRDSFVFDDPDFAFRWASAGALPILRLGTREYYCLFYREIRPIGWNIANGACDSSSELVDPLRTLERELREELIILDPKRHDWCILERGDQSSADRPEYASVRAIVEELKQKGVWTRSAGINEIQTAIKWFNGPDAASIESIEDAQARRHEVAGCYLNINAEDFGIELDRVVKINLSEDAVVCDGEFSDGRLLNRVVGLFRADKFSVEPGQDRFIPDKCFYGGVEIDSAAFVRRMGSSFLKDIRANRLAPEVEAYEKEPVKFNLCPVTRRLLERFVRDTPEAKTGSQPFDVFVSFGHGDERLADQVAQFITNRCGKRVFYYPRSQTDYDFSRSIDNALESAECIVAVGSRLERLTARWPAYEYRTFNVDVHSGKKPNGKLLSLVMGIDPVDLPLPLRRFVVMSCRDEGELPKTLEKLLPYLTGE